MTALDELEKRLDGPGLIVALAKDEARALLSAAREGERMREALGLALDYLGDFEPGDSRTVSNEYVAMMAVLCAVANEYVAMMAVLCGVAPNSPGEEMATIKAATLARAQARVALQSEKPHDRP
jgi:hypothetical protein